MEDLVHLKRANEAWSFTMEAMKFFESENNFENQSQETITFL